MSTIDDLYFLRNMRNDRGAAAISTRSVLLNRRILGKGLPPKEPLPGSGKDFWDIAEDAVYCHLYVESYHGEPDIVNF